MGGKGPRDEDDDEAEGSGPEDGEEGEGKGPREEGEEKGPKDGEGKGPEDGEEGEGKGPADGADKEDRPQKDDEAEAGPQEIKAAQRGGNGGSRGGRGGDNEGCKDENGESPKDWDGVREAFKGEIKDEIRDMFPDFNETDLDNIVETEMGEVDEFIGELKLEFGDNEKGAKDFVSRLDAGEFDD